MTPSVLRPASHVRPAALVLNTVNTARRADQALFAAIRVRRRPTGIRIARIISDFGEPEMAYAAAALAGLRAARRADWPQAVLPLLAMASGAAARQRLSRAAARPRPPADAWLAEPEGFSLPSKHTTYAALAAGVCARAAGVPRSHCYALSGLAATTVGGSRVYLGVHWPGDVLAAGLFTATWLWLTDDRPVPGWQTGARSGGDRHAM